MAIGENATMNTLYEKLEAISQLESQHRIVGVSFEIDETVQGPLLTRECVDHVANAMREAIEVVAHLNDIPETPRSQGPKLDETVK